MRDPRWRVIGLVMLCIVVAIAAHGANNDKALADAEARRKTAANSVLQIKAKGAPAGADVASAYATAATKNKAWLEAVCEAVRAGAAAAPDVKPAADDAASALLEWVVARNAALGVNANLAGGAGASLKTSISQDLQVIAFSSWKGSRANNEASRAKTADNLKQRLDWKPWDSIH